MWQVYSNSEWRNIMSKHNHSHCLHDLKYCEHCDVVYCIKCDREWSGHVHYQPYIWYYYGTPYTIRYTANMGYSLTNSEGQSVSDTAVLNAFNNARGDIDTINCSTVCTHHN